MALLSMRADKFWKKIGKKISIQGSNVAGFDKSKVECFNCHKMCHFSRECRVPRSQERGRKDNYRQESKVDEQTPKALMAIDRVGWDWSYMANEGEDHALVADEEAPKEFALMANTSTESKVFNNSLCTKDYKKNNDSLNSKIIDLTDKLFDANNFIYHYKLALAQVESRIVEYKEREVKYIEKIRPLEFYCESNKECIETLSKKLETLKLEKDGLDGKLAGLLTASKDLDNLIESQRLEKNKEGLGYTIVPPPTAQLHLSSKKYLSWTGLPECADDTVTYYTRPSPTIESTSEDDQNRNPFAFEDVASSITPKPFVKFVKPKDCQSEMKSQFRAPWVPTVNRNNPPVNRKFSTGCRNFPTANRKFPTASKKFPTGRAKIHTVDMGRKGKAGSYQNKIDDKGYWDSGCSRHMTDNISYLSDFEPYDRGYVSFGQGGCKITGKGTIKMECIVLGRDFKLLDDANILLRTPRQHNMYFIDLNNIVPHRDLTCLVAKASADECILWHRRLGHLNFKTMNKLVRHNLVRGLPTKCFENDHTCTACLKRKQHKRLNRVLVNKSHNKTPYELFNGRSPAIGFLKPFGCHVMILNTLDNLGKFEEKGDEGYFIGYSMSSKAFRVFNKRTRRVEENFHVEFLENKAIEKGSGPNWLFDIDYLTKSMNYVPVDAGTISTNISDTKGAARQEPQDHCSTEVPEGSGNSNPVAFTTNPPADQMETLTVETPILTFEDILGDTTNSDESNGEEADINNMETAITTSPTPTLRIHKDHPKSQIIGPVDTLIQTRNKSKEVGEQSFIATIHQKTDPALLQFCLFSCFLSQVEPKKISDALQDPREFEALMHENFQMSAMGELNFFLGLQVLQKEDGIFLSQDKYVGDILKKFEYSDVRSSNTPMGKENPWGKEGTRKDVDLYLYRSMIGFFMYLTASRPDIMFAVEHVIGGFFKGIP
nr:ribonuclease H-like domain-containing protein [Tanacetum cinerariifolium]